MADYVYTKEELDYYATPLSIHIEDMVKYRDASKAEWISDQMNRESLNIYDAYVNWISVLQSYLYERGGVNDHDAAFMYAAEYGFRPFIQSFKGMSFRSRVEKIAARLRMSGSTFSIMETDDSVKFVCDVYGPMRWWKNVQQWQEDGLVHRKGDRLFYPCYKRFENDESFPMEKVSRPLNAGRTGIPGYFCVDILFYEILATEVLGYPLAIIDLPGQPDDTVVLDVPKKHSYIPGDFYSERGFSSEISSSDVEDVSARIFSSEELENMATPLSLRVSNAADSCNWQELEWVASVLDEELVCIKDGLGIFIAGLLSWIARHYGENSLEDVLYKTADVVMSPYVDAVKKITPSEAIPMWAMVWRSHGSTFNIEEYSDRFVFRGRPLGGCHRMFSSNYQAKVSKVGERRVRYPTFGSYDLPSDFYRVKSARPMTMGKTNYPVYSCHCHVLHTIFPLNKIGRPLWVELHPLDDPDGEMIHIHYKEANGWPDEILEKFS